MGLNNTYWNILCMLYHSGHTEEGHAPQAPQPTAHAASQVAVLGKEASMSDTVEATATASAQPLTPHICLCQHWHKAP